MCIPEHFTRQFVWSDLQLWNKLWDILRNILWNIFFTLQICVGIHSGTCSGIRLNGPLFPIQVPTCPNVAWLQWSNGNWCFSMAMAVGLVKWCLFGREKAMRIVVWTPGMRTQKCECKLNGEEWNVRWEKANKRELWTELEAISILIITLMAVVLT